MPGLDDLFQNTFSHKSPPEKDVRDSKKSSSRSRVRRKKSREASFDVLRASAGAQAGQQQQQPGPDSSQEQSASPRTNQLPLGLKCASREEWEDHFREINKRERFHFDASVEVPSGTQTGEQFRQLRTNILLYIQRCRKNVVLFSSCHHGEGKTTTCINLAKFLGMNRSHKVLLIDADLRRPKVRTTLNLKIDNGVEDLITERCSFEEATYYSIEHNISVLPAYKGHSNAAEMLENESFSNLLVKASRLYDVVIVDSCPILSTTDPTIIGSLVGSLMLVVKCGTTQRESILHTKHFVEQLGIKCAGVVLAQMRFYIPKYFYRYHYYQDYYYYYYQKQIGEQELANT